MLFCNTHIDTFTCGQAKMRKSKFHAKKITPLLSKHIRGGQMIWLLVNCFIWFCRLWVFEFRYLPPLISFLFSPFDLLASSVSVKATKELLKEGRKETKTPFKFQLYFWVLYGYFVTRWCLPGQLENSPVSQIRRRNALVIFGGRYIQIWCGHVLWVFLIYAAARRNTVLHQVWELGRQECCLLAAEGKKVYLVSKVKLKSVWRSTRERESQHAAKWTHGFSHHQQGKIGSFQSKWTLLNEEEFFSHASKSVFRHARISLSLQGTATPLYLIYFIFIFF